MCFNLFTISLTILIYTNSGNTKLMNDAEQFNTYDMILKENSIFSNFCTIEPELWVTYCTLALNHIAKESQEYEQMYLDYPAFTTTNGPNSNKCKDTKVFIPVIDELVDLKHLICHGRPIIIQINETNEKFSDRLSIYIINENKFIILEKVDEGKHKLFKSISTNLHLKRPITNELLMLPSPQSTFDEDIIKSKIRDPKSIPDYLEKENHILKKITSIKFIKLCYMIFSRSEYADLVKLLPKREIRRKRKKPRKCNRFLYVFSTKMRVKVTTYIIPIFQEKRKNFSLTAGPHTNSVIVVKSEISGHDARTYELIENIFLEFLDFLVRI